MKSSIRLATAGALTIAAVALFAGTAAASPVSHPGSHQTSAVFVQTDDPSGNSIVVYDRSAAGTLSPAASYPTGGDGGVLAGSVVDHLASQGSLTYDGKHHLLYAVNAGSDTITEFAVRGDRLIRREIVWSGGEFPVSIAVHGDLVYVLNARGGGSIQGYLRIGTWLLRIPSWHRGLGLDASQTPEFVSTPGQIAFTPDGSKLIVTTKNNGNDVDVFAVNRFGGVSAHPVVTSLPGTVPFAVAFTHDGRLVLAEAGTNSVATFVVRRDGRLDQLALASTGQAATCWIVADGRTVYLSNAGTANLSGYRVGHDGALTSLGTTGTDAGTVDAAISSDGRFLYVQTGAAGIVDEFGIGHHGSLTLLGSVTVPGAVGAEGIAAS